MFSRFTLKSRKYNQVNKNNTSNRNAKRLKNTAKNVAAGLLIGNTAIKQISGPVSFTVLRPTQKVYQDGLAAQFPIIVLFGDWHRSTENMCDPCDAPECYPVYDPQFLKQLDALADDDHPVDFYIETTRLGFSEHGFSSPLQPFVSGDMVFCYQKHLCGTPIYKNRYPMQKIRWHATDVRFWDEESDKDHRSTSFTHTEYWANHYATSIQNDIKDMSIDDRKRAIKHFASFTLNTVSIVRDLKSIFTAISVPLVDIYTLTRLFKQPSESAGIRASLCLGYFGDLHTQNCICILIESGFYDNIYKIQRVQNKTPNTSTMTLNELLAYAHKVNERVTSRCQSISNTVPLAELVAYHNAARDTARDAL